MLHLFSQIIQYDSRLTCTNVLITHKISFYSPTNFDQSHRTYLKLDGISIFQENGEKFLYPRRDVFNRESECEDKGTKRRRVSR